VRACAGGGQRRMVQWTTHWVVRVQVRRTPNLGNVMFMQCWRLECRRRHSVLRAAVLRAAVLRAAVLRATVLRAAVLRATVCLLVRQLRAAPIAAPLSRTRGHCGHCGQAGSTFSALVGWSSGPSGRPSTVTNLRRSCTALWLQ
jgi:hypothetical protein